MHADVGDTAASKVLSGIGGAVVDIPSFFNTPVGVASLGMGTLPRIAQRVVSGAFAAQMASQTPEIYGQIKTELAKPPGQRDTQKISQLVAQGIINTGFTVGAALHAAGLPGKGGEDNAIQKRSAETPAVGETPRRGETVGEGIPQPEEPAGTQEANTKTPRKVTTYRVEGGEDGGFVVTAPDGSVVSEHPSLDEAKLVADNLAKPPAQQKTATVKLYSGGNSSYFTDNPQRAASFGPTVHSVEVPRDVYEAGQAQPSNVTQKVHDLSGGDLGEDHTKQVPNYIGEQPGYKNAPAMKLFNLTAPIKDAEGKILHDTGSTVGESTLKKYGIAVPEAQAPIPKLSPEVKNHLDEAVKDMGVKHVFADPSDPSNPFARNLGDSIATIDRDNKQVVINPKALEEYIKTVPPAQRGLAVRSIVAEERNHLATSNDAAKAYWGTKTPAEKKIIQDRYGRAVGMNDTLWGHEAVNFELQRLARMTPHQVVSAARNEKWRLKSLAVLETIIRGIRATLGTKASKEGVAILDAIQKNIDLGKIPPSNRAKADMAAKAVADKDADKLDSMADMYIQSGDAATGEAMKATAKRIRSESGQTPGARPRKRNESVFQDKFFLPGEATQKPAGSTQAVPISGEAPVVPPEERTSAEAAGALPRLTGTQLNDKAAGWVQNAMKAVSSAIGEGKASAVPKFKDFVDYMQGQQPEIKEGQLHEMWAETVAKALDKASGEQLGDLIKGIWGRQVTEAVTAGRKGFFRGIISGAQKVADLPESGQFKLTQDVYNRTPAERYQDERRVAGIARSRDKVIGALFNKLVKPIMDDINFKSPTTSPEDLRYGGGKTISAVHEFSAQDERNPETLGKELVDEARRSKDDPLTASKRLTAIVDRKSGTVDLVSTYRHPAQGTMLVDPNSPQRQHSPLDSILRRYRVIGSFLRDSPVQNFKQHFANLAEFNDKFADEARQRYRAETSYNPESISAEQFQREIGGRMQGTEEGHLMGPGKQLVTGAGQGTLEQSQRTPMTTPEAHAILDYIHEQQGTIDSADDVKEAMMALKEDMNHQALSGLIKLARGLQIKNPDLSNDELLAKVAQRIYENNRDAENLDQFAKRTMAESRPTHGEDFEAEDSPRAINRRQLSEQRDQLDDEVTKLSGRTMAAFLRQPTADRLSSTLDAADTLSNNEARNAEQSIRLESVDKKNFYGKPEILSAANAKLSAGGVKARYHYDQDALDEADRLMKEDPEIKKMADFANRKRDRKNQQMMLEGEVANKGLQQALQQRLIQTGFLNHEQATYFHDPEAKDKLDEFMVRVNNGIEAAGRMAKGNAWDRFRARRWLKGAQKLKAELEFAKAHWDNPELIATAMKMKRELDSQFDLEAQNGYHINYDPNYLPGRYDGELFSPNGVLFGGLRMLGKQFRSAKVFPSYYHAIEAGPYVAASRDGASIVSSRVRQGMRSLNRTMWWNSLKGYKDEASGKPVAVTGKTVDGRVSAPSPEYNHPFRTPDGNQIFIMDGYEHLIHQLTDPSAITHWAPTRAALEAGQFLKHTVLAGDLFHLGRVAYYGLSISGKNAKWRPGWAALDFREKDLPQAVQKNLISKETAAWLTEKLPFNGNGVLTTKNRMELSREFQRQGFNVGQIQDALYKDLVKNIPGFGAYSKFLFDRFTRGQMMNSALTEFQRISRIDPNTDSRLTMRDISRDLNNYFGSIGRQGWVKSATFQDLGRLTFLAPQWLEGLLKKEMSPIHIITQPKRVFSGKDTTLRGIGRGLLAMVALTQTLNLITRRQPTWQNNEKEHKWDAYLGDNVWLSPLAVFNELTGDITRLIETKSKAWDAIQQVGENKLGFYGRAAMVLATGKSSTGEYQTTTAGVLKNAAEQLLPTPISFGTIGKAIGHAVAPSLVGAVPPGRVLAQAFSSMGFKTHTGMSMETRMEQSAEAFNKAHGKNDSAVIGYTDEPSYAQLRYYLSIGDQANARKILNQLEKTRPIGHVIKAMSTWSRRPFTGSQRSERLWLAGMSDEERAQYQQAIDQRYDLLNKFWDSLNQ
jgi:hypothetical protein